MLQNFGVREVTELISSIFTLSSHLASKPELSARSEIPSITSVPPGPQLHLHKLLLYLLERNHRPTKGLEKFSLSLSEP